MLSKKPIKIIVIPEHREEFINFYITLKNFSDAGIDVPAAHVKRFLELMYDVERHKKNELLEKSQKAAHAAVKKLSIFEGFECNWIDTAIHGSSNHIKNDTTKVFMEMIYAFFLFENDKRNINKDDAIAFFYQAFDEHYKDRLDPSTLGEFNSYKQAVISGVLAIVAGFQLSTYETDSKERLFQATRNAIKKYKKD